MDGEDISLYGTGKQIRDVNYVDDVVEAICIAGAADNGWGEAYNLGGRAVSLLDFVNKIIRINGSGKVKTVPFPASRKTIEVGDYIASFKKMTGTYGWKPEVSLDAGIARTIEYYKKYRKYYW